MNSNESKPLEAAPGEGGTVLERRSTRPVPLEVDAGAIPRELKDRRQWVAWRYDPRDGGWGKTPIRCSTGRKADVSDPATWSTFEDALAHSRRRGLAGVGYVFADSDPYTGVDLDKCRDPATGRLEGWAEAIVRDLGTYAEVSPSGTGVKLIARAKQPPGSRTRRGKIEMYSRRRYFALTGYHLPGTPTTIEDRQQAVQHLYEQTFGGRDRAGVPAQAGPLEDLPDDEIIARAGRGRCGVKFAKLWAGDTSDYPSESEGDPALCGILAFWVGNDPGRIERIFARSALATREKWATREGYRRQTIEAAIAGQKTFHRPRAGRGMLTRRDRSSQIDRDNQEESGRMYTVHTTGVVSGVVIEGDRSGLGERSPSGGAPLSGLGQGVSAMVIELADRRGQAPDWEVSFELARRLRSVSAEAPEPFEGAVREFCERAGKPFEEFWYAFLGCWEKVRFAEGEDIFAWAAAEAARSSYPVSPCPGPMYATVASIAYHLSRHTAPEPFWLPRERLAKLLEVKHAMTVTRIIDLLVKHGVIVCVNENFSYRDKTAKEYAFIGKAAEGVAA